MYEGRSINKLLNGTIPSVLKIGKNPKYTFCRESNSEHTYNFDDDVIIVTSSDNRTQSICVLFSPRNNIL